MKTNVKVTSKQETGITLIALVVTIVVLLILAGVTVSLQQDENGIIEKSKVAKIETRASQVEDEVGMWKLNNFISKESNQEQESADEMLEDLISRKLLTEDEIDRNQELITIKKNDGTVVKEISYSSVTINISKTPATEKAWKVLVKVDSVDGLATIKNDEEFYNFINSLSDARKKEIIRNGLIKDVNDHDSFANCTTFQDVLDYYKNQGWIEEATEEAFWHGATSEDIDHELERILQDFYYNEFTNQVEGYTVTNPDNEASNTYIAKANDTYTFKIQDIVTGKIYTKKVEVTNVDTSLIPYFPTTRLKNGWTGILMFDTSINDYTTFEKAYIILNGEKIEIDKFDIGYIDDYMAVNAAIPNTSNKLVKEGKIEKEEDLIGTTQTFILEKDGVEFDIQVLITVGEPGEPS